MEDQNNLPAVDLRNSHSRDAVSEVRFLKEINVLGY